MAKTDIIQEWNSLPINISNIYDEFKKSILNNRFFQNKQYLIDNSRLIRFDNDKWFLRPEYFSQSIYGDHNYYLVVLLVNNITSRFNFRRESFKDGVIYAPSKESIDRVLNQNI